LKAIRRRLVPQRGHLMRVIPTFITIKMNKPATPAMYQLLICSLANVAKKEQLTRRELRSIL
jgi:hypothetical protein